MLLRRSLQNRPSDSYFTQPNSELVLLQKPNGSNLIKLQMHAKSGSGTWTGSPSNGKTLLRSLLTSPLQYFLEILGFGMGVTFYYDVHFMADVSSSKKGLPRHVYSIL